MPHGELKTENYSVAVSCDVHNPGARNVAVATFFWAFTSIKTVCLGSFRRVVDIRVSRIACGVFDRFCFVPLFAGIGLRYFHHYLFQRQRQIHGTDRGGDCDELRLLSDNTTYINLRAHGGSLSFLGTKVQHYHQHTQPERNRNEALCNVRRFSSVYCASVLPPVIICCQFDVWMDE